MNRKSRYSKLTKYESEEKKHSKRRLMSSPVKAYLFPIYCGTELIELK